MEATLARSLEDISYARSLIPTYYTTYQSYAAPKLLSGCSSREDPAKVAALDKDREHNNAEVAQITIHYPRLD